MIGIYFRFILIILILIGQTELHGKCKSSGIHFNIGRDREAQFLFPMGAVLIDAMGSSQTILDSLNKGFPIYFISKSEIVDVQILQYNKSQNGFTQVLVQPIKTMKLGSTYKLIIECLPRDEFLPRIKWKIRSPLGNFGNAPIYNPIFLKTESNSILREMHTPWIAKFYVPMMMENNIFIKAQIGGECFLNPYIVLFEKEGKISITNSNCGGRFRFSRKKKYMVRFSPIDENGIEGDRWTNWVKFEIS